jgi:hypothetical protein
MGGKCLHRLGKGKNMHINELREYQLEFEKKRPEFKKRFKKISLLRDRFVRGYSVLKIQNLKLDEYIVGKGEKTFCNRIENELNLWGNMHGSPSKKFGIYFGVLGDDQTRKYRIGKKDFGDDIQVAFYNVKQEIIKLINDGKSENYESLKSNLISPMFKGKILSLYYPEKYLNILSAKHLDYFISFLGIENSSKSELDKRSCIMNFKNSDSVMKDWSMLEISKFLYKSFGNPNDETKDKNLPDELKGLKLKDFPPIEKIRSEVVDLNICELTGKKKSRKRNRKPDYERQSKNAKRIGDRGEQIVLKFEKDFLKQHSKVRLSNKVKHISKKDDRAGYDILSFDINGDEKFIEVKSTQNPIGKGQIQITANEYNISQELSNYYIYVVYDAGGLNPKIWKIKANDLFKNKHVKLITVLYRIELKTEKI